MSLRLRLALLIGGAFLFVWAFSTAWLLRDMGGQLMATLDARLEDSAHLLADLAQRNPELLTAAAPASAEEHHPALWWQIADGAGAVLAHGGDDGPPRLESRRAGFQAERLSGERWRSFTLVRDTLRITVADRVDEREALFAAQWHTAALPVLFALPLSLALLWLGICQGLAPLRRLRNALATREARSREALPEAGLPREIAPLAHSLNQLLERVGDTMEREARFTSNAAHELRTPLTAIKTHLQVARLCQGESANFSVQQAEVAADRLQRILAQLLLLARLDGEQPWPVEAPVPVAALMADLPAQLPEGMRLSVEDQAPADYGLALPLELALVALRNLLENAAHHAPADSVVDVDIGVVAEGVCFTVRDRGPGVAAEDLALLGERFRRLGDYPGSGLGLALVKAIAARFGGSLVFENARPGLRARLVLPVRAMAVAGDIPPPAGPPRRGSGQEGPVARHRP